MHALVAAWCDAIESFESTVSELPDEGLHAAIAVARMDHRGHRRPRRGLGGRTRREGLPAHEPDWDALPHADDLFSRYTEIGVDFRQGRSPAQPGRNWPTLPGFAPNNLSRVRRTWTTW